METRKGEHAGYIGDAVGRAARIEKEHTDGKGQTMIRQLTVTRVLAVERARTWRAADGYSGWMGCFGGQVSRVGGP